MALRGAPESLGAAKWKQQIIAASLRTEAASWALITAGWPGCGR